MCVYILMCVSVCVAVMEAVERWKAELSARLAGGQKEEEEEEETLYAKGTEEVRHQEP